MGGKALTVPQTFDILAEFVAVHVQTNITDDMKFDG